MKTIRAIIAILLSLATGYAWSVAMAVYCTQVKLSDIERSPSLLLLCTLAAVSFLISKVFRHWVVISTIICFPIGFLGFSMFMDYPAGFFHQNAWLLLSAFALPILVVFVSAHLASRLGSQSSSRGSSR